jgi:hypothetical protein
MGAAYNPPNQMDETYPEESGRGCVARLEYHISEWSAFWLKLQDADLTPYANLAFDIRADEPLPRELKIELKRFCDNGSCGQVSVYVIGGITPDWLTRSVPLSEFGSTGFAEPLSSMDSMDELVFTFEVLKSGTDGTVYLDNVRLEP